MAIGYLIVLHILILVIFFILIVAILKSFKKMDKKSKEVTPYIFCGVVLIFVMMLCNFLFSLLFNLDDSVGLLQGSQMLLILAGFLFFKGILGIYQEEIKK